MNERKLIMTGFEKQAGLLFSVVYRLFRMQLHYCYTPFQPLKNMALVRCRYYTTNYQVWHVSYSKRGEVGLLRLFYREEGSSPEEREPDEQSVVGFHPLTCGKVNCDASMR
jgi:hypothetical protein